MTERGSDVLRQGEAIFEELRDQWAQRIGAAEVESIEDHLTALIGAQPVRFDTPGWITRDVGEPEPDGRLGRARPALTHRRGLLGGSLTAGPTAREDDRPSPQRCS